MYGAARILVIIWNGPGIDLSEFSHCTRDAGSCKPWQVYFVWTAVQPLGRKNNDNIGMKAPVDLYGLKNCDTCRKASKALDAAGIAYVFHDIRDGSLSAKQVSTWLSVVGGEALVNRRSTTWRNLSDMERQQADSENQLSKLLLVHPTLIKRPVIVSADSITVGWTPEVRAGFGL